MEFLNLHERSKSWLYGCTFAVEDVLIGRLETRNSVITEVFKEFEPLVIEKGGFVNIGL